MPNQEAGASAVPIVDRSDAPPAHAAPHSAALRPASHSETDCLVADVSEPLLAPATGMLARTQPHGAEPPVRRGRFRSFRM